METIVLSKQEIFKIRSETAGTTHRIHFNNAGASLPPDVVIETVVGYLHEEAIYGGYETEYKYRDQIEKTYSLIAKLINAAPDEIAITENASTAWGMAFNGLGLNDGDEVITSEMEYVSNLLGFLHGKHTHGIKIKVVSNDAAGNFLLQDLKNAISDRTKLIAITHIASSTGGMMPINEIGKIARGKNILYLVDGCQSAGHFPIDVKEIKCDMLSVTGRKYLRGPRGTGFLYIRKDIQDKLKPAFMDQRSIQSIDHENYQLRADAKRFELFEKNRALGLGLGKAVEYILDIGIVRIWERIRLLASHMRSQLTGIEGITVHDRGENKCGIVTFSVDGNDSTEIKNKLAEKNINVSVAIATSTLIFMDKNHLSSILRASVHYYNTEEEIQAICEALIAIIKERSNVDKNGCFHPEKNR